MQIEWQKCPSCGGTRKETGVGLRCMTCRGKGRLPLDPARYRDCEQCDGKGYLLWGDNPEDIEQTGDGAYRNIRDPQEPVNFACAGAATDGASSLGQERQPKPPLVPESGTHEKHSCGDNRVTHAERGVVAPTWLALPAPRHRNWQQRAAPLALQRKPPKCGCIANRSAWAAGASSSTADGAVFRTDRDSRYPGASLFELTATES